ncbi:MAG: segregation/condensation protein A, partial [Phascolarctobacterium sp.]|nr:segregation/condensation protein A [Candidatus Phascolarctobacterium equi]
MIKVEQFEGPLDLLLHLIHENKYDIFDIPIVEITDQYMGALNQMQEFDMEVATEFLLMAATLLQIKSRMLLPPKPVTEEDEEEAQDPRQVSIDMLVEYKRIKLKAGALAELKALADKQLAHKPMYTQAALTVASYTVRDLLLALTGIVEQQKKEFAYIEPQAFSVEDKMEDILIRLANA